MEYMSMVVATSVEATPRPEVSMRLKPSLIGASMVV